VDIALVDQFAQTLHASDGSKKLYIARFCKCCDSCRVIAAIFKNRQPIYDDLARVFSSDVAYDATHGINYSALCRNHKHKASLVIFYALISLATGVCAAVVQGTADK